MTKDKRLDLSGKTLGQYKLIEVIGEGGLATVYKAEQLTLERLVAVKVLDGKEAADDQKMLARFEQEAKAIARLQHTNILVVYEYGIDQGQHYIAMQYVEQGTLADYFNRAAKPLDWFKATQLAIRIAEALHHAHRYGLIHRDVKPSNILMMGNEPRLADFGLVKVTQNPIAVETLTDSSLIMGTPEYMSPEQAKGDPVDARSDMYSLGVVLFEMVAGRRPFEHKNQLQLVRAHLRQPPPSPRLYNSNCPAALEQVILTALRKSPEARYADMQAMIDALNEVIDQATGTGSLPEVPPEPTTKESKADRAYHQQIAGLNAQLKLEAVAGGDDVWFDLLALDAAENGLTIGRSHPARGTVDIDLKPYGAAQKGVSHQHARLFCQDAVWFIEDLKSKNGTYLNRVKLEPEKPTRLKDKDVIHCAHLALTFSVD